MQYEEIINCPKSGGDLCYRTQVTPDISNYLSLSCGFWTNSLMKEGEEFYNLQMEILPELYKDLAWKDPNTDLVWIPNNINIKEKGMVFANGTNAQNWQWAAVKAIKIPKKDQKNHPIPGKPGEFMEYRMDMANLKSFHERDYIEALDYIGVFEANLEPQK
jgi:hypothetical protein